MKIICHECNSRMYQMILEAHGYYNLNGVVGILVRTTWCCIKCDAKRKIYKFGRNSKRLRIIPNPEEP